MTSADPHRWPRRARTIPTVLAGSLVALALAPLAIPVIVVVDLVRGRRRWPLARTYLFGLRYGVNDSAEILAAPLLWAVAGLGRSLASDSSQLRHWRLLNWSVSTLHREAGRLLGLDTDVSEVDAAHVESAGPLIVLTRHVSMLDSSVPALALGLGSKWTMRGVFTDDVLADPGFDLIYQRIGSVFIDRDDGPTARRAMAGFSSHDDAHDAVAIFPEGGLATPGRRQRALDRMAESHPARAERLAGLRQLLPPRPGGTLALLEALPTADVLVLGHVGAELLATPSVLAHRAPVDSTLRIRSWRIPRSEIPVDPSAQIEWLDRTWLDLDGWVDRQLTAGGSPGTIT
ncbi:MAG: hypothetical protein GY713_10090 [Actinomycetia bacterium]|nr:hypothetical protein [Actinomycetes bacterium]